MSKAGASLSGALYVGHCEAMHTLNIILARKT